jgi:hypothetical protein
MTRCFHHIHLKCLLAQLGRNLLNNVQSLQHFQSSLPEACKVVWNIMSLAHLDHLGLDLLQVVAGHVRENLNKKIDKVQADQFTVSQRIQHHFKYPALT